MHFAYYLVAILFLLLSVLEGLGFINIEITNLKNPSLPVVDNKGLFMIIIFGLIAGTLAPFVQKWISNESPVK